MKWLCLLALGPQLARAMCVNDLEAHRRRATHVAQMLRGIGGLPQAHALGALRMVAYSLRHPVPASDLLTPFSRREVERFKAAMNGAHGHVRVDAFARDADGRLPARARPHSRVVETDEILNIWNRTRGEALNILGEVGRLVAGVGRARPIKMRYTWGAPDIVMSPEDRTALADDIDQLARPKHRARAEDWGRRLEEILRSLKGVAAQYRARLAEEVARGAARDDMGIGHKLDRWSFEIEEGIRRTFDHDELEFRLQDILSKPRN